MATKDINKKKNRSTQPVWDDWDFVGEILNSTAARTIFVWGAPGTGKTYSAMNCGLRDREVFTITLTPDTPSAELRGFWIPKGDEFVWQDGPFIHAMRRGARVVINEISNASHDVLAILHPVLESQKTAQLTLPNLETVRAASGFQVVCTDNMPIDQLPEALRDRFNSVLHVGAPHPDALARLPKDLREAALRTFDLGSERAVSIRGWLAVHAMEAEFGRAKAIRAVFGQERGDQIFNALTLGAS